MLRVAGAGTTHDCCIQVPARPTGSYTRTGLYAGLWYAWSPWAPSWNTPAGGDGHGS